MKNEMLQKSEVISLELYFFFVQKHSCLVFIFTTSSSRLDTSVEATNKGIWAQAEIEPYNLICCWDLLSTLSKSTFFQDIQKLTLNKVFSAVCLHYLAVYLRF